MTSLDIIQKKYEALSGHLDERSRRIWAAAEAQSLGHGGTSVVSRATGLARSTIHRGIVEMKSDSPLSLSRVRKTGGGRKTIAQHEPTFPGELESLIEPLTRGDPESPLRWTCKSTRQLADELANQGIQVGRQTVTRELHKLGYSLQGNRKTQEGNQHPDRNAQFEHINILAKRGIKQGAPVISVDTKKKELIGNYKNNGQKWHRKGQPHEVKGHDFPNPEVPRAYPYGIYDLKRNEGFVNVGSDHDTSSFAVASIRAWWLQVGQAAYSGAKYIQIMADGGGSNGHNRRLWKWELQALANETGLPIRVSHFPPGTSKWNKVEHRLFSFISQNWRAEPLTSYETIVNLIASTTTRAGLKVHCQLDVAKYPLKRKISDQEMKNIRIKRDKFHGEWNYKIEPTPKSN